MGGWQSTERKKLEDARKQKLANIKRVNENYATLKRLGAASGDTNTYINVNVFHHVFIHGLATK